MNEDDILIHEFIATVKAKEKLVFDAFINIAKYDVLPRAIWDFESRFVYVNELFADAFGYTSEEMNGQSFDKFIIPEDLKCSIDIYEMNTTVEQITVDEGFLNRYRHKNGSVVYVRWMKFFNDFNNRIGSGQIQFSDQPFN